MVPEKQGLKHYRFDGLENFLMGLSSGSRKTRIETPSIPSDIFFLLLSK